MYSGGRGFAASEGGKFPKQLFLLLTKRGGLLLKLVTASGLFAGVMKQYSSHRSLSRRAVDLGVVRARVLYPHLGTINNHTWGVGSMHRSGHALTHRGRATSGRVPGCFHAGFI